MPDPTGSEVPRFHANTPPIYPRYLREQATSEGRLMGILRSLLVFLWMAVTVIPFALAIILMAPFVGPEARWWYLARPWLSGAVEAVRLVGGIQYSVEGEQGLPTAEDNQRIILCPKHQSTWEHSSSPVACPILWLTFSNANYFISHSLAGRWPA